MNFLKLGWRWGRPNDLVGPDQRPIRDTFMELQRWMTWPYVGLSFSGTHDLTGAFSTIPLVVQSSASSPFVAGDPYNLYRTGTSAIQVPQDYDTWMFFGAAGCLMSSGAADTLRSLTWRHNSATIYPSQMSRGTVGGMNLAAHAIHPVRKGDTLDVQAACADATVDVTAAKAWAVFFPLG